MKLEEALGIRRNCDPLDCDCDECPIGKEVVLWESNGGVKLMGSVCGFLLELEDMLEEQEKADKRS